MLLAIDTSTRRVGVALGTADGVVAEAAFGGHATASQPRHAELLVPTIDSLLASVGTTLADLAAIAVAIGPGMFTGLRVGITTAVVLASALDRPVVPVPSLDLLALPLCHAAQDLVVPVLDARRNEVYWAAYRPVPGGVVRETDDAIATPAALAAELAARGERALLCGDGAVRFADAFAGSGHVTVAGPEHAAPSLVALVALGARLLAQGATCAPADVAPRYLRKSDAEINATPRSER